MIAEWRADAVCASTDPEVFFPEPGYSSAPAKRICLACDVRVQCQEWAIEHGEKGIWGGLSEGQRREIRKARDPQPERQRMGGKPAAACGSKAAYERHVRNNEPVDEACAIAYKAANAAEAARRRELRRQNAA